MRIAFSDQMREIDRYTIEKTGIPGIVLMENAGRETVNRLRLYFDDLPGRKIAVFCGKGNNGGDGYVIARHLWNLGCDVSIGAMSACDDLNGDARTNAEVAVRMGIPVQELTGEDGQSVLSDLLEDPDIVIDALLGTGTTGPARGLYAGVIDEINESDAFIVSVDVPSGLLADSPAIHGPTVSADLTVTYGLPKPGLLLYPAAEKAGQLCVVDISIPSENIDLMQLPNAILTPDHFPDFFAPRLLTTHKGRQGHLLIIAGSPGKTGAALLAAKAAARAGPGLVTLAIPAPLNGIAESLCEEIMTLPLSGESDVLHPDHFQQIVSALPGKTSVLMGPGIGTCKDTCRLLMQLLPEITVPLVIDADALNIIAENGIGLLRKASPVAITPHPGEFSRLTGLSVQDLLQRQLHLVPEFARRYDCTVVLKTARTLVSAPSGNTLVNITGNPGLATGGTGDVLAGLISGLMARHLVPVHAVSAGVFWHGLSGDLAVESIGEFELLAGDLLGFLGEARQIVTDFPDVFSGEFSPYPDIEFLN